MHVKYVLVRHVEQEVDLLFCARCTFCTTLPEALRIHMVTKHVEVTLEAANHDPAKSPGLGWSIHGPPFLLGP
jgi:hypothetical protein